MDLGIGGKVALVMGSSRGIGRGIAEALAEDGARVAISGRSLERLREAAAEIEAAVPFAADTNDLERMAALPAEIEAELGPIEILVLNAGGPPRGTALEHGTDAWEEAYRSLVLAPRLLIEAALPGMRERGWGRIVNVSSSSVREPIPGLTLSNSNRMAARSGYFDTLAREVAADGVTVNTIATGRFATPRLASNYGSIWRRPKRLPGSRFPPSDSDGPRSTPTSSRSSASERAAYLTGTVIPLDGGLTARPRQGPPPCAPGRRGRAEARCAGGDHREAQQLRLGQADEDVVVAADELDQESLGPRGDQVEREEDSRTEAVAQAPEDDRDDPPSSVPRTSGSGGPACRWGRCRRDRPSPKARPRLRRSRRHLRAGSRRGRSRSRAPAAPRRGREGRG